VNKIRGKTEASLLLKGSHRARQITMGLYYELKKNGEMKENFTQVPNVILDNETLSWDEKGVMTTFFRNKREWKAYKDEFIKRSTDGKTVINRIFKSLEEKGFIDKQIEGGVRLKNGRFTPTETYFQLSVFSIKLLEGTIENPVKSTVSRQPNSGYLKPLTENPLSATNNINYNNINYNNIKENKTNSVSESVGDYSNQTKLIEHENAETETETEIDFLFVEGIEGKVVSPLIEDKSIVIESNGGLAYSRVKEGFQEKETTPAHILVEREPIATKKVEGIQAKEKQASSKYFFNYGEKPSLDKITAYATHKGYSTETAYEVFNVLVDNDYCDSGGNQILSIETYINTMLSQKKKELNPDAMKELRAISDGYADLYASELDEDRYGVTTHRLNMWDFVKYYLSTHDNDTESAKKLLKLSSEVAFGRKPSSYILKAKTKEALRNKANANANT
jgi:hypothetical protein